MRRFCFAFVTVALAAALPPSIVQAQYTMAIRGGLFLPTEGILKDKASQWLGVGFDIHVASDFLRDSDTVLSADYLSHAFGGSKGSVFPLTINQFFYSPMALNRFYWGIGAGATVADVDGPSKTVFGLKGTVGVELEREWFVEASYFWSDEFDEATDGRVNGVAFYVGYRF